MLTWVFTIAVLLLLFRVLTLHRRTSQRLQLPETGMAPGLRLALLKNHLLESPSPESLKQLLSECKSQGYSIPAEDYAPLLKQQLRKPERNEPKAALLEADAKLYGRQSLWLDSIEPPEQENARMLLRSGDRDSAFREWVQSILRLYSDERVLSAFDRALLGALFPEHHSTLSGWRDTYAGIASDTEVCAQDSALLSELKVRKERWVRELETMIRLS